MNDKQIRLEQLKQAWEYCVACQLANNRTKTVFGYGNPDAQIIIVGEAPGQKEDESGLPFVGPAGHLLDQYLQNVSANPELVDGGGNPVPKNVHELRHILLREFFFTNVVACRPPNNDDPPVESVKMCMNRLREIIYIIDPVLIITVGRIALEALTGKKMTINSARGELYEFEHPGRAVPVNYPVLAVLHTSYLLRQNDFDKPGGLGHLTYTDFMKGMRILDEFNWRHFGIPKPDSRRNVPIK